MPDTPTYNWDIKTTEPPLAHVALQARFNPIDDEANDLKASSRRRGYVAVGLGAFSLLAASAASLLKSSYEVWLAPIAAFAGVFSIVIGLLGVLHARTKRTWLERRYQTERMRQFHFQSAIALLPELLAETANPASKAFTEARKKHFDRFCTFHIDAASDRLSAILNDEDPEGWIFGDLPAAAPQDSEAFRAFETTYRHNRLGAQIDYCDKKLKRRSHVWIPGTPAEQSRSFGTIAVFCIMGATALHIVTAIMPESFIPHHVKLWLNVGVLWLAVGVLAVRALEEGLRPHREVERYRQYRSALRVVETRLNAARSPGGKIAAMKQLEEISFEEMKNFLKDNDQARFVM